MKLITFLGLGNYQEIIYDVSGSRHKTKYFQVALARAHREGIKEILVVLTKEAKEKHWGSLEGELVDSGFNNLKTLTIPQGTSEEEIWEMFQAIIQEVGEGESLIYDITHGFRSIPVIVLLSIAYIKAAKNCDIKGIYYGAFEARQAAAGEGGAEIAPTFDLTPFVIMLDWIQGVQEFRHHGESDILYRLLNNIQGQVMRKEGQAMRKEGQPVPKLEALGKSIEDITVALNLNRSKELRGALAGFQQKLEDKELITGQLGQWAAPLLLMLDKIEEDFRGLATGDPDEQAVKLVQWQVRHRNYLQAATYMREALVTKLMRDVLEMEEDDIYLKEKREEAEVFINKLAYENKSPLEVPTTWSKVRTLRNDLAHCGFRQECTPASKTIPKIEKLSQEFERILKEPGPWQELKSLPGPG